MKKVKLTERQFNKLAKYNEVLQKLDAEMKKTKSILNDLVEVILELNDIEDKGQSFNLDFKTKELIINEKNQLC